MGQDAGAEALAGVAGMDEDGADFGGVGLGVEEIGLAEGGFVGSKEGFAHGPAAASSQFARIFGDEVGAVADELGVEAEDGAEGALDLRGGVVVGLQAANGGLDEGVEGGDVRFLGEANCKATRCELGNRLRT